MEESSSHVIRDRLPDIYAVTRDKSEDYNHSVGILLETYPLEVARLLALISIPMHLTDYQGWDISNNEYLRRIERVYGLENIGERGRTGDMLRRLNDHNAYTPIMEKFTYQYYRSNGVQPAPINHCISVQRAFDAIDSPRHSTAVLRDIASIMSTMHELNAEAELGYEISTPYDALFTVRRLGATTGAISEVYLAQYMSSIPMIIKTNSEGFNYQLHEYVVGLRVNELRDTIANFVYTYGFSSVLNPTFSDIDDPPRSNAVFIALGLYNAVDLSDRQVYIEYLRGATTIVEVSNNFAIEVYLRRRMQDFPKIEILTGRDVFEVIFLQLMSALFYAWKRIGFAHRDLNPGNVMLHNLKQVTAVPIMVPAGINEETNEVMFVRRWLITDVLVVVIDYGYSSVEIPEYREQYGTRVISPVGVYGLFEGTTTIENDIMNALRYLYKKFGANREDFIDMISLFYTGNPATEEMYKYSDDIIEAVTSLSGGAYIYPEVQYYVERALIKYCVKYSNKWTHSKYNPDEFPSVIGNSGSTLTPYTDIITDSRQAYLALMDEDTDYNIDDESVIDNEWYRRTYVERSLPFDTNDTLAYVSWMIKFYKWTNAFSAPLNMQPLSYKTPIDFLRNAYRKIYGTEPDNDAVLIRFVRDTAPNIWRD